MPKAFFSQDVNCCSLAASLPHRCSGLFAICKDYIGITLFLNSLILLPYRKIVAFSVALGNKIAIFMYAHLSAVLVLSPLFSRFSE